LNCYFALFLFPFITDLPEPVILVELISSLLALFLYDDTEQSQEYNFLKVVIMNYVLHDLTD